MGVDDEKQNQVKKILKAKIFPKRKLTVLENDDFLTEATVRKKTCPPDNFRHQRKNVTESKRS